MYDGPSQHRDPSLPVVSHDMPSPHLCLMAPLLPPGAPGAPCAAHVHPVTVTPFLLPFDTTF